MYGSLSAVQCDSSQGLNKELITGYVCFAL